MRTGLFLFSLASATVASAQTAAVIDLTGQPQTIAGVDIKQGSGFTEYRLGIWVKPAPVVESREATAALEQDLTTDSDVDAGVADAGVLQFQTPAPVAATGFQDACLAQAVPGYIPGLAAEVVRRRLSWWSTVSASECRYGLPAGLLDAVILQESRYRVGVVSPKGAVGLTQLMPGTAGDLGVRNSYDPVSNIDGGARYLRAQLDRFNSIHLGVAAYNAGPGAVRSARGIPRNSETPNYVRRVLDYWSGSAQDPLANVRRTAQMLGFTTGSQ